jgi:hypothetical protein
LILLCLLVGVLLSAYMLMQMIAHPYEAFVGSGHIVYKNGYKYPSVTIVLYVLVTAISLLLSSHKAVQLLAAAIFVGFAVAYISFHQARLSVWCFFAAAASVLVYLCVSRTLKPDSLTRAS